eukprot:IDg21771t1
MAIIGLTLSDNDLEQVRHATTSRQMWNLLCDIYEKHTLLNKLAARRRFYTAKMAESEKIMAFAARVRQLASTLKSMSVPIDDNELAMSFLNGLPERFDSLIGALDALGDNDKMFTFSYVISRCEQEEQRHFHRNQEALRKSEAAALFAPRPKKQEEMCKHCSKHRDSNRCYRKFPHLAPPGHPAHKPKVLLSKEPTTLSQTESDFVCLLGNIAAPATSNSMKHPNPSCSLPTKTRNFSRLKATCLTSNTDDNLQTSQEWIIDSGCTDHMTYDHSAFLNYSQTDLMKIDLGASSTADVVGECDIKLTLSVNGKHKKCILKNVKHVPKLRYQLLSVSSMAKLRIRSYFDETSVQMVQKDTGCLIATGQISNGLYTLDHISATRSMGISLSASLRVWHNRLAHVSCSGIKRMAANGVAEGLIISLKAMTLTALDALWAKVKGPLEIPSIGGDRYVITFIDDFTNWTADYTMVQKSEAFKCFKTFKAYAENHTGTKRKSLRVHKAPPRSKIQALRSDNGGEYLSNEFKSFLRDNGIRTSLLLPIPSTEWGYLQKPYPPISRLIISGMDLRRTCLTLESLAKNAGTQFQNSEKFIVSRDVTFADEECSAQLDISNTTKSDGITENATHPAVPDKISEITDEKSISSEAETAHPVISESPPTAMLRNFGASDAPSSYEDATSPTNIDFWKSAILKEENSLRDNNTFKLVQRQHGMHVLPCRYVFKVKKDVGPKVRIVAKGFRQVHGVDYNDTYAPVVSLTAVRSFLATVSGMDLECDQMDVVTAFLNGDLDEDIYMEVPEGFKDPSKPNLVCKLKKALYGLRQAPRSTMMLVLYIDDLLIADYANLVLDRFEMRDSKPIATPMEPSALKKAVDEPDMVCLAGDVPYRQTIGSLMYLMICIRPDIAYAVGKLSQYCEKPLKAHWTAVKRVLRYIGGTSDKGIMYDSSSSPSPVGYSDSDWAGCVETRKSTEGFVFLISGGAISWRSKKQTVVATSSCEAEYISVCSATKEAIWLSKLLSCLQGKVNAAPMKILVDNQGAIASAHNWSINARNKHIDIRYHFVREAVLANQVNISYCSGADQLADRSQNHSLVFFKKICAIAWVSSRVMF